MISHELKCIFVHIPKTAGQSIEHALLNHLGIKWHSRAPYLLRKNDDRKLGPERLAHLKAIEYTSCGHVDQQIFESYFKFAFVRNPWDRLVSEFHYRTFPRKLTFEDFVYKHTVCEDWTDRGRHIIPQSNYLFEENGNQLVDYVGRFEEIERDFEFVRNTLNLRDIKLP